MGQHVPLHISWHLCTGCQRSLRQDAVKDKTVENSTLLYIKAWQPCKVFVAGSLALFCAFSLLVMVHMVILVWKTCHTFERKTVSFNKNTRTHTKKKNPDLVLGHSCSNKQELEYHIITSLAAALAVFAWQWIRPYTSRLCCSPACEW